MKTAPKFTLMVIGDEILAGNRQDKHFAFFKSLLQSKGLMLDKVLYLPDEPDTLIRFLRDSFLSGSPAFVTGGIGATPDDHTRAAAAAALGVSLVRHPEALALIETVTRSRGEKPDDTRHLQRAKMADFPAGAALVHNPVNGIAGFSIKQHYFLPGFPEMAHPMAEAVLERDFSSYFHLNTFSARSLLVEGLPESAVSPLMEAVENAYPGIKTYSLPTIVRNSEGKESGYRLEIGLKAEGDAAKLLNDALQMLTALLHAEGAGAVKSVSGQAAYSS